MSCATLTVFVMWLSPLKPRGWSGGAKVLCILHHWGVQHIGLQLGKACYPCSG